MKFITKYLYLIPAFIALVMLLASMPGRAQAPHPAAPLPDQAEAGNSADQAGIDIESLINPMDRMRTDLTRHLALLNKMSQISQVLEKLKASSPVILTLLDESIPYEERVRAALGKIPAEPAQQPVAAPPPAGPREQIDEYDELEELRYEVAALRMQLDTVLQQESGDMMPAVPEPMRREEHPDWKLTDKHIDYVQVADASMKTSGWVALAAADQTAELDVHDTISFAGKTITLSEIDSDGRNVILTFVEDGELTRISLD